MATGHYGFNADRSKVEIYSKAEVDAIDLANDQALAQEAADRAAADSTLGTRINTIIASQDLDPNKDNELVDVRAPEIGVDYAVAGDHVRALDRVDLLEVSNMKMLSDQLEIEVNLFSGVLRNGFFNAQTGAGPVSHSKYVYLDEIDVSGVDSIKWACPDDAGAMFFIFYDADHDFLSSTNKNHANDQSMIDVPQDAVYLRVEFSYDDDTLASNVDVTEVLISGFSKRRLKSHMASCEHFASMAGDSNVIETIVPSHYGTYNTSNGALVYEDSATGDQSVDLYRVEIVPVIPGEVIHAYSYAGSKASFFSDQPSPTYGIASNYAAFLRSRNSRILIEEKTVPAESYDVPITVPDGAYYALLRVAYGYGDCFKVPSPGVPSMKILENAISTYNIVACTDSTGYLDIRYNFSHPGDGWKDTGGTLFHHALVNVAEPAKYLVDCFGSTACNGIMFFNDQDLTDVDSFVGAMCTSRDLLDKSESYGAGRYYQNVEVIPPSNAKYMLVQGLSSKMYSVKKLHAPSINSTLTGISYQMTSADSVTVSTHYNASKDIVVSFGKRGPNNLPDFKTINIGSASMYNNATDWHGPFIVAAKSNIDGDDAGNHTFTGGNHNYNNQGDMNASATGRCVSFKVFADGVELSNGDSGNCNIIEFMWVNRVQGYNTRKSDGSGREILEERHRLSFDGKEWCSYFELEPLENIKMEKCYGFQAQISNWPTVFYVGGAYKGKFNYASPHDSGNALTNMVVCCSSGDRLEMEVDRSFDLGKGEMYGLTGTQGMHTQSYGKTYAYLINNKDMNQGAIYAARGYWRFMPVV